MAYWWESRKERHHYAILNLGVSILLRVLDQAEGFPSNTTLFQQSFTILFKLSATCFGRTTIFRRKYMRWKLTFLHGDGRTTEIFSG
jgi:hypothetical protein